MHKCPFPQRSPRYHRCGLYDSNSWPPDPKMCRDQPFERFALNSVKANDVFHEYAPNTHETRKQLLWHSILIDSTARCARNPTHRAEQ